MLNKLILIENGKSCQFSGEKDLVEYIFGNGYYKQLENEKLHQMELNALAQCINTNLKIIKITKEEAEIQRIDVKNKFVIFDEKTYILSLLMTERVVLLERINSNIFTKNLDKTGIKDNYIIVNTFAEKLLDKYING